MKSLIIIAVVMMATVSMAATWHVAQDGSGDFTAIQPAVDVASSGDVIIIHAGRYEGINENHDLHGDGTIVLDCHVAVETDGLTLRGEGPEVTIIGPVTAPGDPDDAYSGIVSSDSFVDRLIIEDLAIENTEYGVLATCLALEVANCRFENAGDKGFYLKTSSSATFNDCRFIDCHMGGIAWLPSANVSVVSCSFENCREGLGFAGAANVQVTSCSFDCIIASFNIQQGSYGVIRDCVLVGRNEYAYGISISLAASLEVYDCDISGGNRGVIVSDYSSLYSEGLFLHEQTYTALEVFTGGSVEIHNSDIVNGGGWSVECGHAGGPPDCYLNMANNYWGTGSQEQIEEWIFDSNDNPDYCCSVDFIPFEGVVAAENRTWTEVKSMFRSNGK